MNRRETAEEIRSERKRSEAQWLKRSEPNRIEPQRKALPWLKRRETKRRGLNRIEWSASKGGRPKKPPDFYR